MTVFIAGVLLGSSMFALPSSLFIYGWYSWIGWLICTVCTMFLVVIFSALSEKFPAGGGPYQYTINAYGSNVGLVIGIIHLMGILIQNGAIAYALSLNLQELIGMSSMYIPIVIAGCVNSFSFGTSASIAVILSVLKIIPILIFTLLGVVYIDPSVCFTVPTTLTPVSAVFGSVLMIIYAFAGIEFGLIANTKEVHEPATTIPRALWLGTILGALIFILTQAIVWSVTSPDSNTALADAAYQIIMKISDNTQYGLLAKQILISSGILFTLNALNTSILITGHFLSAMAVNNHLPQALQITQSVRLPIFCASILSMMVTFLLFDGLDGYQSLFRITLEASNLMMAIAFFATALAYGRLVSRGIMYKCGIASSALLLVVGFYSILLS
jgi:APA family basic amino acid/polyamine antiporter